MDSFDPFSPFYLSDPYLYYAQLPPLFYYEQLNLWVISKHEDVEAVLKDPYTFSAVNSLDPIASFSEAARRELGHHFPQPPTLVNADVDVHRRIRPIVQRAFSPRRVKTMERPIRSLAAELISDLPRTEPFDLVARLSYPVPAYVIFKLLGFPPQDFTMLKSWCGNRLDFLFGLSSDMQQLDIAKRMRLYWNYCIDFIRRKFSAPGDDLTTDLIAIRREEPDLLTELEIAALIFNLSLAGHETTTNLISNAVRRLLEHRQAWEALGADSDLVPGAVEETLRYDTSVISWRRVTTKPVSLHGQVIPVNSNILLLLAAAGRDPDKFRTPERFDIYRNDSGSHLAFGKGIHYCAGASLARLEAGIVLELLTKAFPDLQLEPDRRLDFISNLSLRGPKELWVRTSTADRT
ncbi:cytochrome P450 [Saccharopolyspora sp. K220]|nr:cytochrome P450 [Saccharopolyspora soli]